MHNPAHTARYATWSRWEMGEAAEVCQAHDVQRCYQREPTMESPPICSAPLRNAGWPKCQTPVYFQSRNMMQILPFGRCYRRKLVSVGQLHTQMTTWHITNEVRDARNRNLMIHVSVQREWFCTGAALTSSNASYSPNATMEAKQPTHTTA